MNSSYKIIGLCCLLIMAGCRNKPVSPEDLPPFPGYFWADYIGTYDVYDTISHTQWVMKIKHISQRKQNNGNSDSIYVENFANKINVRFIWPAIRTVSNRPAFGLGIFHPIKDKNNFNWHLGCAWDDSSTLKEENVLKNDSMTIYFTLSNIAFYQADGVPYYDCDCKHIAVKRY